MQSHSGQSLALTLSNLMKSHSAQNRAAREYGARMTHAAPPSMMHFTFTQILRLQCVPGGGVPIAVCDLWLELPFES
jgi:hypothetical protein